MLLFLIFFFVPLALTAPLSPSTIIGNWTLSSFSRSCSPVDNMCNYGFDLIEGRDIERDSWVCFLTANGTSQSSFSNAQCFGFGDRFLVNGGWSGAGKTAFMTLVVTDQAARGYAFFGIAEGDFDDVGIVEHSVTSPAYSVGTPPSSAVQARDTTLQPALQVMRLKRVWIPSERAIDMTFLINDSRAGVTVCAMRISETNLEASWYAHRCDRYSVSWGYMSENDAAVMTVCDQTTGMDAFFGYEHVSDASTVYRDTIWEPLHKTGCT